MADLRGKHGTSGHSAYSNRTAYVEETTQQAENTSLAQLVILFS